MDRNNADGHQGNSKKADYVYLRDRYYEEHMGHVLVTIHKSRGKDIINS